MRGTEVSTAVLIENEIGRMAMGACGQAGIDCGGPGGGELPGFAVALGGWEPVITLVERFANAPREIGWWAALGSGKD